MSLGEHNHLRRGRLPLKAQTACLHQARPLVDGVFRHSAGEVSPYCVPRHLLGSSFSLRNITVMDIYNPRMGLGDAHLKKPIYNDEL